MAMRGWATTVPRRSILLSSQFWTRFPFLDPQDFSGCTVQTLEDISDVAGDIVFGIAQPRYKAPRAGTLSFAPSTHGTTHDHAVKGQVSDADERRRDIVRNSVEGAYRRCRKPGPSNTIPLPAPRTELPVIET